MMVTLTVNGTQHSLDTEPDTPLLWVLRDQLNLTGTKYGCGIAQCGACTVHVGGQAMRSCVTPLSAVQNQEVITIEGLSDDGLSHPLQVAWREIDVPQCGYCQSGQIMAAAALLASNPNPTEEDIASSVNNLCRCGTYLRINKAILQAAEARGQHKNQTQGEAS
ncbi:isoquinoline 1-oxidoreductase, alpha subunit [Modicisalibacter ilicicola DSM 19980]|uniref:Isoquinoline 1-oxidoreductase, alpha subunit n=2 Tax=Modicisalibacter ilicicola TaxID=480814 RepID=A0A1M4SCM3_9GAMM|nr:(2Fe-2S)-binding protein [Halomonas ilicicola]SHE29932.1 isoquinoline 1-oxidoreductase, alpha subunit [Halomonas ilicicola DSM 19980]